MQELLQKEIQQFIRLHENDDPYHLSLTLAKAKKTSWPVKLIIEQIQARKKAKEKMPGWYQQPGILFPPTIAVEQASSEIAARFKSSLVKGKVAVDLTGGMGVDSYFLSKKFDQVHYVEQNEHLAALASHNFKTLQQQNLQVQHQSANDFLSLLNQKVDLIFIDPSRRTQGKIFRLEDSEPNIEKLLPILWEKASQILLKSSPLQDISQALKLLSKVSEVWVVAIQNDCKEVLYLLTHANQSIKINCLNIKKEENEIFNFYYSDEATSINYSLPLHYLYEPNVSILKAGAFKSIAAKFNINKLHKNSHLYTSDSIVEDFPGRIFKVEKLLPFSKNAKKDLPDYLNIISRNFPVGVQKIATKLGLKEGGEQYLIATTLTNHEKKFILASRIL